jgi:hypothetical protein
MSDELIQAAVIGPTLAGGAWAISARFPLAGRALGGALALTAHAAAWVVFWAAFRGDAPSWRTLTPGLLGASLLVAAELGILFSLGTGMKRRWETPATAVGLGAATTAVVVAAYSHNLIVQALFLTVPTIATAAAALSARDRPTLAGLGSLALADVVALIGLSVSFAGLETVVASPGSGLAAGPTLLLAAAALKTGAVPGLGTWRLTAAQAPSAALVPALRGQGLALAALAALVLARAPDQPIVTGIASGLVLASGAAAILARGLSGQVAAVTGAAVGLVFLTLGLGGIVATRAFLLLFPAILVAAGAASLGGRSVEEGAEKNSWTAGLAGGAMLAAVASLLALPPGGGFPGGALALGLATSRVQAYPWFFLAAGSAALGLSLAALGGISLVRSARARLMPAVVAAVAGLILLYMGSQPVRLSIGWLVRVEAELGLAQILPASGAPHLPTIGGAGLLGAAAPAVGLLGAVLLLGRGVRSEPASFSPLYGAGVGKTGVIARVTRGSAARLARLRRSLEEAGVGFGALLLLEAVALGIVLRLLVLSNRTGFL